MPKEEHEQLPVQKGPKKVKPKAGPPPNLRQHPTPATPVAGEYCLVPLPNSRSARRREYRFWLGNDELQSPLIISTSNLIHLILVLG